MKKVWVLRGDAAFVHDNFIIFGSEATAKAALRVNLLRYPKEAYITLTEHDVIE